MVQVETDEARSRLSELIDAAVQGEQVYIAKDDETVVQLVPVSPAPVPDRRAGSARGLIRIREDFDAPLDDFADRSE